MRKTEFVTGVPVKRCLTYKKAKKGQTSFRITQQLLQSIWQKSKRVKSKGKLILTIPANKKEDYVLECNLRKEKNND